MATTAEHQHHASPADTRLNAVAFSATLHCLTGCAIGEVLGMVVGTALGFSNWGTIGLAVGFAFLFGYGLTSLPLLRSGMALAAVVPIALASDTLSIGTMEIVDNAIVLVVPGAMDAGLGDLLFWGALSVALVVAGGFAYPVNRWLIERGKGHAVVHETGVHGGPPTRLVAIVAALAAAFGTTVLVREAVSGDGMAYHGAGVMASGDGHGDGGPSHGGGETMAQDSVRGLAVAAGGLKLALDRTEMPRGQETDLRFRIVGRDGQPVRDYEVEHTKRLHLIVVRRDMVGFQHLHPTLGKDGTWSTPLTLSEAGSYRVFADFKREGRSQTLGADLAVDGQVDWEALPPPGTSTRTADGYEVRMQGAEAVAGKESELRFEVARGGRPVEVEPYLGARGHLVALREGDLAYLHVHPTEGGHHHGTPAPEGTAAAPAHGGPIVFGTEFPSAGRYRLFLQFKQGGQVHTAEFTLEAR